MEQPSRLLLTLWKFVRGDTPPRDFERWLYSAPDLETKLGGPLYMAAIETNFGNRESVFQLRQKLRAFASAHYTPNCQCVYHPDVTVLDMGEHEGFFSSMEATNHRGQPLWWLSSAFCKSCGQNWLVASEEWHNDVYILRRLRPDEADAIANESSWPTNFDRYETLLQIGRDAGRSVRFVDPLNSSMVDTVRELATNRPGIRITELASLLSVSNQLAEALVSKAREGSALDITMDFKET